MYLGSILDASQTHPGHIRLPSQVRIAHQLVNWTSKNCHIYARHLLHIVILAILALEINIG